MDRITVDLGGKVFPSGLAALGVLSLIKPVHGLRLHSFDFDRYAVQKGMYVDARREEFCHLRALPFTTRLEA